MKSRPLLSQMEKVFLAPLELDTIQDVVYSRPYKDKIVGKGLSINWTDWCGFIVLHADG